MYNERKAVFSLNLYSQHVGVAPQGMQVSSTGRTPAFPVTCPIQSHPDPHGFGCCLSLTLMESAVKKHVVVERLVAADASKCVHYQDSGNNQAPVDLLTQRIHCAVALWQWKNCLLEDPAQLVTVHSIQSLSPFSTCPPSSLALPARAPKEDDNLFKN